MSAMLEGSDAGIPWWNYPGLESWKFVNLLLFILIGFYLHRRFGRPIKEGLRLRSEAIKAELKLAKQERDQALAKLSEVESRFANLDVEVSKVKERNLGEIEAERERISSTTEGELARIRDQAKREIESAGKTARQELRQFAAQESIRLAEGLLKQEIGPAEHARLTNRSIEKLRGSQR
ncbi:MAG: ATP synthase F0 subunit B [Blastocatellia bacterium]|nr:ATP synthase F0 subunit B [Blastocatellia bacterium]